MSLRLRVLVLTGLAFVGLFAVLHGSLRTMLLRGFASLETNSMVQDVERATRGLQREIDALERTCRDWAEWDDAYRFVLDRDPEFVRTNLVPSSFVVLDLDVLVIVDPAGQVVTAIATLPDRSAVQPVPASLVPAIARSGVLGRTAEDPSRAGLVSTPEGVMAVAGRAILSSQARGPSRGTLVMGRFLREATFSQLAAALRIDLSAQRADTFTGTDEGVSPAEVLAAPVPVVKPLDAHRVAGLIVRTDLAGAPALVVRVLAPRTVYQQGVAATRYLELTLGAATVVFAVLVLALLERTVLAPLTRLESGVQAIAASRSPAARVEKTGGGELDRLSVQINEMLGALEQADHELHASEERFRSLFERCPLAIFLVDPISWKTLDCNQAAVVMTGFPREELVGRDLGLLGPASGDTRTTPSIDEKVRALADRGVVTLAGQRRRADGQIIQVEVSVSHVAVGTTGLVMSIERDISDRLRLEDQLRQSHKLEAVGTLASGVAHNFNNILQIIGGFTSLLRSESHLSDKSRERLDRIEVEVRRASALTSKLIAFSRAQQGQVQRVDLCAAVRGAEGALKGAAGPRVDLTLVVPSHPVWVRMDAHQLTVVLAALAENAREAMTEGGSLTVAVRTLEGDGDTGSERSDHRFQYWAQLDVADTGCGMDESTRQRVFEPFFSTKGMGSGSATGMGLAIVHGIVTQHNCRIEVESAPACGTTIKILFPLAEPRRVAEG